MKKLLFTTCVALMLLCAPTTTIAQNRVIDKEHSEMVQPGVVAWLTVYHRGPASMSIRHYIGLDRNGDPFYGVVSSTHVHLRSMPSSSDQVFFTNIVSIKGKAHLRVSTPFASDYVNSRRTASTIIPIE